MSFFTGKERFNACPKTGKPIKPNNGYRRLKWLFPITGLAALVWFLIRVIPKPSRALYPCQRVAFPLASGFIVWLTGALGSIAAYHRARAALAKARYALAIICIIASVGFVWLSITAGRQKLTLADEPPVPNEPVGVARGVNPGRVAWIHDANATDWAGPQSGQYWYTNQCTDQETVNKMFSEAIRTMTGEKTDPAAWDAIFHYFNQHRGKGDVGYTSGEKIGIKINHTLSFGADPVTMDKTNASWHMNPPFIDCIDNSPQLTIALLRQLIDNAGVAPGDISIGDPGRIMPNYWYDMVEPNCPGVVYIARVGGKGRTQSQWSGTEFNFSDPDVSHWTDVNQQDHIPHCFADAAYFINFPVLKSHGSGGLTVCGKNFYGSLIRNPNASDQAHPENWYNMHITLPGPADPLPGIPGMGHYRCVVDLMGHPQLGGKTLLCLVDGLFAGIDWDSVPVKWLSAPFNNDWPSSIFVSQDQVAVDSVAFDFLYAEWNDYPHISGADDYLYEAAMIPDPCSGTNYDPNNDGGLTESLGVHEHWNNSADKQYSRNLDPVNGTGIELATESPLSGDFNGDGVDFVDFATFTAAWRSTPGDGNWNPACDISMPSDNVIDEKDLLVFCENWLR